MRSANTLLTIFRNELLESEVHRKVHASFGGGPTEKERCYLAGGLPTQTAGVAGERGCDGGKKINGRKRHLLVDTQGLVLAVKVHAADVADRDGVPLVLSGMPKRFPEIKKLWTDSSEGGILRIWAAQ